MEKLVSLKEIERTLGISRTSIWRHERRGEFPQRVCLTKNRARWRISDITNWVNSRQIKKITAKELGE